MGKAGLRQLPTIFLGASHGDALSNFVETSSDVRRHSRRSLSDTVPILLKCHTLVVKWQEKGESTLTGIEERQRTRPEVQKYTTLLNSRGINCRLLPQIDQGTTSAHG
jgi:hypothetical protein